MKLEGSVMALPEQSLNFEQKPHKAPLLEQIKNFNLESVAIFTGAVVDPDGLACGLAMEAIVKSFGATSVKIFCMGTFNRSQNKTMKEVLDLNILFYDDFNEEDFTCFISVDGPAEICPTPPDFIIDHHKPGTYGREGTDVRPNGSASSIVWEYVMAAGIDLGDDENSLIATALAIGIETDTNDFRIEGHTALDVEAYAYCLLRKDHKSYLAIKNWPRPEYYNDMYAEGWANKIWNGTVCVAALGVISEGRSGVISDLAETYLQTLGINTTLVAALVGDKIMISMRTSNTALDVDEFMKHRGGGGKRGAAAGKVTLPMANGLDEIDRKMLFDVYFSILSKDVFKFTGDES